MRNALILAVMVAVLLTACSKGTAGIQPAPGGAGLPPADTVPGIAGLDRLRSVITGPGIGDAGMNPVVAQSPGVEQVPPLNAWRLCPDTGEGLEWVVISSLGPLKPADGNLRYTWIDGANENCDGEFWLGVSDYSTGRWCWQRCTTPGWYPGSPPDSTVVAIFFPEDCQPVSPDGFIYLAAVACGNSQGRVPEWFSCYYEHDSGFLEPPVLVSATGGSIVQLEIDPGPDIMATQCSGLEVWRCEGEVFDPVDYGSRVRSFDTIDVPHYWDDESADPAVTYTYALALRDSWLDTPRPGSPFSNTITVYGEE